MKRVSFRSGLALLAALVLIGPLGAAVPVPTSGTEPPPIEGQPIARVGGGWLGLRIEAGTFRLRFYDSHRQPVAPDVARAVLRWKSNRRVAREVAILTPGADPNLMTSERTVPPPYSFRVTIVLLRAGTGGSESDEAGAESITVDFRQEPDRS